jgi:serine/threonine protein kinase
MLSLDDYSNKVIKQCIIETSKKLLISESEVLDQLEYLYPTIKKKLIITSPTNYEILEEIGKGRKGTIYRGFDIINKRDVAIKKILSGLNADKEIENHLLLNNMDCVPKLYDYFEKTGPNGIKHTYLIQQLLFGHGLHATWKRNENWDFIWMTVHLALIAVKEFHNSGYYHGDMHLNNFVWTGEKLYIIDFDKLTKINKISCDDYSYILSTSQFARLGQYEKFSNINKGYEKFMMLYEYSRSIVCDHYYISNILWKYDTIDKLQSIEPIL